MNVHQFRPLFEDAWKGYPDEVKQMAWDNCFRRTKNRQNGVLSNRVVAVYKILKNLKPPYESIR